MPGIKIMVGGKGVRENEDNRIENRLNQKFLQLHQETKD